MTFGITANVKAETFTNAYWSTYTSSNRNITFSNVVSGTHQYRTIDLDLNNLNTTNYNSIKGFVYVSNLMENKFYSNSWTIELDCNEVGSVSHGGYQYTITYADGTHATVTGTEYDNYCEVYGNNYTNNIVNYQYNFDNRPQMQMQIVDTNNNYLQCEFDSNYNFTCPGGRTYKQIVL